MQTLPTSKRPRLVRIGPWLFVGGTLLACLAGYINVTLLDFFHVPVSHMSGAVSRLSIDLGTSNLEDLSLVSTIVGAFLSGSVLSGLIIGKRTFRPGRRYGLVMMLEGLLLGAAAWMLSTGNRFGLPLASLACGLQNAMASSYYGLVLRTTHVTGMVTDIGLHIGQWIRHRRGEPQKILLLASLLCGFFAGGLAAATAHSILGSPSLYLPATVCFCSGLAYFVWRKSRRG